MSDLSQRSVTVILRLVLNKGEVCRLLQACRGIQVRLGNAWVTLAGEDIILASGETAWLLSGKGPALVSALGRTPLILEVLGDSRQGAPLIVSPALNPGMDHC